MNLTTPEYANTITNWTSFAPLFDLIYYTMNTDNVIIPEKRDRQLLPTDFEVTTWEAVKPYFDDLLARDITSTEELRRWFNDRSELEAVLSENLAWRYIKMTCDTTDEDLRASYTEFITEIEPKIAPVSNELNKIALSSPYLNELKVQPGYPILIRELKKDARIFREENIPLKTEEQQAAQQFGAISGAMTVEFNGQEITLQQAANKLQSTDRAERETAYRKITQRRLQDKDQLNELFTTLIGLRDRIGRNAGFANYRDYMFEAMGRFDYTPQDCFNFHEAVAHEVTPILDELARERKATLGVDSLRPWDKSVDPLGQPPLKPFTTGEELTEKTIQTFGRTRSLFGRTHRRDAPDGPPGPGITQGKGPGRL